ncbi:hypothetical protein [Actinomadura sp. CNU-125]|uniref:hypothetical protein n=1 Tax=Actinomadura sp. CNU-125 TaxID=1904961 RepID=UPI0009F82E7A|nr:hypothetical protein [Actinomadura sp. CNU-125]
MTSAVWTPLIGELPESRQQDVVLLSPPGFGAALPAGFGAAHRAGARAVDLDALGHWWMLQGPARAARMLSDFWDGL